MAGYNEELMMSNKAVESYEKGEKPLSGWTHDALMEALAETYPNDMERLSSIPTAIIRHHFLFPTGAHHVGKNYRMEEFYGFVSDYSPSQIENIIRIHDRATGRIERMQLMHSVIAGKGSLLASIMLPDDTVIDDAYLVLDEITWIIKAYDWKKIKETFDEHNHRLNEISRRNRILSRIAGRKDWVQRGMYIFPPSIAPQSKTAKGRSLIEWARRHFPGGCTIVKLDEANDTAELLLFDRSMDDVPFEYMFDLLDAMPLEDFLLVRDTPRWTDYSEAVTPDALIGVDFRYLGSHENTDLK